MENGNVINKVGKPLASNIQCFFSQLFLKVLSGAVPCSPSPPLTSQLEHSVSFYAVCRFCESLHRTEVVSL